MDFSTSLWSGICKGVASAFNAVITGIETAVNWIVGAINGIIGGFNKIVSVAAKIVGADWSGVYCTCNILYVICVDTA